MTYPPSHLEVVAAEFRVLPLRRFIKDQAYWAWVSFWMWLLPPLTALTRVPLMAGCQGYFEYRDSLEFPALHRWYSYRWARSRAARQDQGGDE